MPALIEEAKRHAFIENMRGGRGDAMSVPTVRIGLRLGPMATWRLRTKYCVQPHLDHENSGAALSEYLTLAINKTHR